MKRPAKYIALMLIGWYLFTPSLALAGWYLLAPPDKPCATCTKYPDCLDPHARLIDPDLNAPLSSWAFVDSFDSAKACTDELDRNMQHEMDAFKRMNDDWFNQKEHLDNDKCPPAISAQNASARCFATNDPRLAR